MGNLGLWLSSLNFTWLCTHKPLAKTIMKVTLEKLYSGGAWPPAPLVLPPIYIIILYPDDDDDRA